MERLWLGLAAAAVLHCGADDDLGNGPSDMGVGGGVDQGSDGGIDGGSGPDADMGGDGGTGPDMGEPFFPPAFDRWVEYRPEGATCADGSPYKFYVNFSLGAKDVVIVFEGGGACWDYDSCTGSQRSAANREGLPDDYADRVTEFEGQTFSADFVYPLLSRIPAVTPTAEWNAVFMPYCTGDTFTGNRVVTYESPEEQSLEFHHTGHRNVKAALEMMKRFFTEPDRLLVSGCSAGGVGSLTNYHTLRAGLNPARGYLLSDSGPLFPDQAPTSWSLPLHDRVQQAWGVDELVSALPAPEAVMTDFGALSTVLSDAYPDDRLASTFFRMDLDFSLYSYERFYTLDDMEDIVAFGDGSGTGPLGLDARLGPDRAAIYRMWWDDTDLLTAQYDRKANLGYFIPFYRTTNRSHCTTIPAVEEFTPTQIANLLLSDPARLAWTGTEIPLEDDTEVNIQDYVEELLDDQVPVPSYFEQDGEGPFLPCTPDPRYNDPDACLP